VSTPATPLYLTGDGEPAFGLYHQPEGPRADVAVVLCPPFGWEDMTSYRGRRAWAEQLAASGHPTLRIDLPGTGDSAGGPQDPGRAAAWAAAIDGAARWLRQRSGCSRVAALGIGAGGLLAAHATAAGAPVDDLVLWGVPARGRTLVREMRAFARLEASRLAAQGAPDGPPLPDGAMVAAGYLLTAETRAALEAIDLTRPADDLGGTRVLLLERDGMGPDADLEAALRAAGAEVETAPGPGYSEMVMGDMQAVRPTTEVFERVSGWLDAAPAGTGGARGIGAPVAETASLELDGGLRETPIVLPNGDGQLFGVLTEPPAPYAPLTLVLLNAGPQRHTGPNRMWVEMARRWAARGVPALRLDVEGIGDADGVSHGYEEEWAFYEPRMLDQVTRALDALQERGLPARFVLLGLCSGANWAFHAAQRDDRVAAAVLLNPRALWWNRWMAEVRGGREVKRLAEAGMWRRLLAGEVSRRATLRVARATVRRAVRWPLHAWAARAERRRATRAGDPLEAALSLLRETDRRLLVVFTDREPLRDELEADGRLAGMAAHPAVRVELIASGAETHTLQPPWIQERVHGLVDAELERELERARAAG
jgi:dienelactone hydrolase